MFDTYLADAGNDSTVALVSLERDILLFSGEVIALETDTKKATARVAYYQTMLDNERGSLLERIADSDVFKLGLFVAGVWLGTYAASQP